jgi:hypothetical protein
MGYEITKVTPKVVHLIDLDNGISVTNDAENVVSEVHARYPNCRIVYRDTAGYWDELVHNNGTFTDFAPIHGDLP